MMVVRMIIIIVVIIIKIKGITTVWRKESKEKENNKKVDEKDGNFDADDK